MFFIIAQKIVNLLLGTNQISNHKIILIGVILYSIFFLLLNLLFLTVFKNHWLTSILFVSFLTIDKLFIDNYYFVDKFKTNTNTNQDLIDFNKKIHITSSYNSNSENYESTSENDTTLTT